MTPKQEEVLKQIKELAREHFDNHVFIVDTEDSTDIDRIFELSWHGGGLTMAMGLTGRALTRLQATANAVLPAE